MSDLVDDRPIGIALKTAIEERYLAYALSTITARSLPDVRDGLKPVQRRLLYAMRQLRLDPQAGFKKCARVVGDVIGKYHPHGDQAVYDALVRMAQTFAQRYELVQGQGNFGTIDGDGAAAMRYTEARLTPVAEALLAGIDDDTVDFRANYDGSEQEPVVLPSRFPNLLANGAAGIAVGMATSIPPHNVGELCDALLHLIKHPNATAAKLAELVPGPDLPTGGVLVDDRDSVVEAYATGRGAFRLRAKWHIDKGKHGQYSIIVTEIPYQVAKARLIQKIAGLIDGKGLSVLADIRDESAEDVRIVLEPKSRTVDAAALMEALFRQSDLEVRVPLNMNVLADGRTPRVMNLRGVLQAYLDHRHEVLLRGTRHRHGEIGRRVEVLEGYLAVFLDLDAVIRIVREEDDPKAALMVRFDLSEVQAEAILNMRLRALRRLEELVIRKEHAALVTERMRLDALLEDPRQRWAAIADEVRDIAKAFGKGTALGRRRTEIGVPPAVQPATAAALVEREPITVICSEKGWIRSVGGHLAEGGEAKFKEGDRGRFRLHAETSDRLVLFATSGRFYTLPCGRLPRGRGHGEPLRLMFDLGNDEDIVTLFVHRPGRSLLVVASDGRGFLVSEDAVLAQTRQGRRVLNVASRVEAQICVPAEGDTVAVVGENRKLLLFPLSEVPTLTRGRGVRLQRYREGGVADARAFVLADGLAWQSGGRERRERDIDPWLGKRGQAGRMAPRGFPRNNRFG